MSQHQVDPNECLMRIRELVAAEQVRRNYRNGTLTPWETRELVDLFSQLDGSLSRGDYLPSAWYVPAPATVEQLTTEQERWNHAASWDTSAIEAESRPGD